MARLTAADGPCRRARRAGKLPRTGLIRAAIGGDAANLDANRMGVEMRSSYLFTVLVGVMPLLAFTTTMWLTDGAPFEPYGGGAVHAAGSVAPAPAGTAPARPDEETTAVAGSDDWSRLRRLARDGDTGAAVLLAILNDSRTHADRQGR